MGGQQLLVWHPAQERYVGENGTAGFTENTIPDEAGLALSWFVLPEHQRQGFATEITKELLRFAFDNLGADRILVETHPENPASRRVLDKLSFTYLGERKNNDDDLSELETQDFWEFTQESWQQAAAFEEK